MRVRPAEYPQDTSASPFGIALSGDHIYWTDFSTSSVYRAHKSDGSEFLVLLDQLTSVSGITLVSKVDLDRKGEANCRKGGIMGKKGEASCRKWGIVGKKGRERVGDSGEERRRQ